MQDLVQQAPLGVFVVMVGLFLAMSGGLVAAGVHARRTAAAVEAARAEPMGMATDGYRRFEGRAEAVAGQPLRAPLTGAACVWYEARLERLAYDRQTRTSSWALVRAVTSSAPVVVRDDTGACVVDVLGADVTPTDRSRWIGAGPEPDDRNPPRVGPTQSLDDGIEIAGGSERRHRYTESRIYPGDAVLVVGQFSSGRFTHRDDDEDDDDPLLDEVAGETEDLEDVATSQNAWQAYDMERADTLAALAHETTRARMTRGGAKQPLILAAATAATHVAMNEMGAQAAFYVALVPLGVAVLILLARFS